MGWGSGPLKLKKAMGRGCTDSPRETGSICPFGVFFHQFCIHFSVKFGHLDARQHRTVVCPKCFKKRKKRQTWEFWGLFVLFTATIGRIHPQQPYAEKGRFSKLEPKMTLRLGKRQKD